MIEEYFIMKGRNGRELDLISKDFVSYLRNVLAAIRVLSPGLI
jgi:hypothetical protein